MTRADEHHPKKKKKKKKSNYMSRLPRYHGETTGTPTGQLVFSTVFLLLMETVDSNDSMKQVEEILCNVLLFSTFCDVPKPFPGRSFSLLQLWLIKCWKLDEPDYFLLLTRQILIFCKPSKLFPVQTFILLFHKMSIKRQMLLLWVQQCYGE